MQNQQMQQLKEAVLIPAIADPSSNPLIVTKVPIPAGDCVFPTPDCGTAEFE